MPQRVSESAPDGMDERREGAPNSNQELFGPGQDRSAFQEGIYVTLRLTSSLYHRFHAPHDCVVDHVTYLSGDTWNVNPIVLTRVERLFCRNERAVLRAHLSASGHKFAIVPVAAILVASIRLHFLNVLLHLRYRGPSEIARSTHFGKGDKMGWLQHGPTVILFAPHGFALCEGVKPGARAAVGRPLLRPPPR